MRELEKAVITEMSSFFFAIRRERSLMRLSSFKFIVFRASLLCLRLYLRFSSLLECFFAVGSGVFEGSKENERGSVKNDIVKGKKKSKRSSCKRDGS